jgi:hypothetical protein
MKVPPVLRAGDSWLTDDSNLRELTGLLQAYGVNIHDCYEIHFGRKSMQIYRWKVNETGHKSIENGSVARRAAESFTYQSGLTPEVS